MKVKEYNAKEILRSDDMTYLPSFSVDCVIISFDEGVLKILLNKFTDVDKWMLPGGFVRYDKDVEATAYEILDDRTGLADVYLRQFYLFGKSNRNNIEENREILANLVKSTKQEHWYLRRFVSLGFYALVEHAKVEISTDPKKELVEWFSLNQLPQLYADHGDIIKKAIYTIRVQLGFVPVGYELLPEKFTMPELRQIYESILGVELDRRNFQRKMLSLGLITKLNEKKKSGAHKAPNLYSFNKEKYEYAEQHGLQLMSWNTL